MEYKTPVWMQLLPWVLSGLFGGMMIVAWLRPPNPPPQLPESPPVFRPNAQVERQTFNADAAIMVRFVRPEMADQYEASLVRVKEAMDRSLSPTRHRQAIGWRVFRALQRATNGDLVYIFEIDPPVKDADYAISRLLAESFAEQGESLFRRYAECYSGPQNLLDLKLVNAFAEGASVGR